MARVAHRTDAGPGARPGARSGRTDTGAGARAWSGSWARAVLVPLWLLCCDVMAYYGTMGRGKY